MTTAPACIHYWKLETAQCAQSHGECVHCGEERAFSGGLPEGRDVYVAAYANKKGARK